MLNGLFGLFDHPAISRKKIALVLVLKSMAIPAFYFLYEHHYGGMAGFDSGKFFSDVSVLNECAKKHPATFIELFFGLQDEKNAAGEHAACLEKTQNWLKGRADRTFYHDNRILIRIHTLLHFIAFDSWFVHAFFSCLMSFTGLFFLFRTFSRRLEVKEFAVFLIVCLFPSLWLYTGALLKEGLLVCVLGLLLWLLRKALSVRLTFVQYLMLTLLLVLSFFLKPYLLVTAGILFTICLFLEQKDQLRFRTMYLAGAVFLLIGLGEAAVRVISDKSVLDAIAAQQRMFNGMAAGGIFMSGDTTYLKLDYDTTLIRKADNSGKWFTISYGAQYMYWNDSRQHDTLYSTFNTDTVAKWELEFATPASRSNFVLPDIGTKPAAAIAASIYHGILHPFFFNATTMMEFVASFENLVLAVSAILIIISFIQKRKGRLFAFTCLLFVLLICVLVTLTSPNTGAVLRYRAPAVIFLPLGAIAAFAKRKQTRR